MKIAAMISRILLGLVFVVFGLNGFLHFLKGPLPPGLAGQFAGAMATSHYDWAVSAVQVAGGLLLLVNRFVPLGMVLLGPILVNILLFHALMLPAGIQIGAFCTILWFVLLFHYWKYFAPLFVAKAS